MKWLRRLVALGVVVGVVAVILALYRGAGPLPDPEGCHAKVNGYTAAVDPGQGKIAALISAIGVQRGLPARAVSIALATGFQESKLRNLTSGDRDSVGIFQQRPSQGWGTAAQIRRPVYAINRFYDALEKVHGYQSMRITVAAQKVQRSGYPEAYAVHEADARTLASALTGYSPGGMFTCVVHDTNARGTAAAVSAQLARGFGSTVSPQRESRQNLRIDVAGRRQGWAVAAFLVGNANQLDIRSISFDGKSWSIGRASEKGWVADRAARGRTVRVGMG